MGSLIKTKKRNNWKLRRKCIKKREKKEEKSKSVKRKRDKSNREIYRHILLRTKLGLRSQQKKNDIFISTEN
jgi:hypothetical protein